MSTIRETIEATSWARELSPELRERVLSETYEKPVAKGCAVFQKGDVVDFWTVVVDGLVKMGSLSAEGKPTSFIAVSAGGWFGEGSLLKNEARRYDMIALRDSVIGFMPRATFDALRHGSFAFANFLINQLNERLGQFIALVGADQMGSPGSRVAHCLASLYNPTLYPRTDRSLEVSQEEMAHLAGLSRQTVNHALKILEDAGLLRIGYRGIEIRDLDALQRYRSE